MTSISDVQVFRRDQAALTTIRRFVLHGHVGETAPRPIGREASRNILLSTTVWHCSKHVPALTAGGPGLRVHRAFTTRNRCQLPIWAIATPGEFAINEAFYPADTSIPACSIVHADVHAPDPSGGYSAVIAEYRFYQLCEGVNWLNQLRWELIVRDTPGSTNHACLGPSSCRSACVFFTVAGFCSVSFMFIDSQASVMANQYNRHPVSAVFNHTLPGVPSKRLSE